jgi:hypothetical protein
MTGAESPSESCRVCGDPADDTNSVMCGYCGRRFHLRLRQNDPGVDCGEVWVNDESLTLDFACFPCLRGGSMSDGEEPPVGAEH